MKKESKSTKEDKLLIEKIVRNKDRKSQNKLYNKYFHLLSHLLFLRIQDKDTSNDLSCIILNKAFKNLHKYDSQYSFSAWLTRIRENTLIDYYKNSKNTVSFSQLNQDREEGTEIESSIISDEKTPEEQYILKEKYNKLHKAIENLGDKEMEVIKAFYFEELKLEEISDKLCININSIKTLLHRAKLKLKEDMSYKNSYNKNEVMVY